MVPERILVFFIGDMVDRIKQKQLKLILNESKNIFQRLVGNICALYMIL